MDMVFSSTDVKKIIDIFELEYSLNPICSDRELFYFIRDMVEFVDNEFKIWLDGDTCKSVVTGVYNTIMYNNTGKVITNIKALDIVRETINIFTEFVV